MVFPHKLYLPRCIEHLNITWPLPPYNSSYKYNSGNNDRYNSNNYFLFHETYLLKVYQSILFFPFFSHFHLACVCVCACTLVILYVGLLPH